MSYLIIEIKNPKARKLLNDLRDRNLISINEDSSVFFETVRKIKKKADRKRLHSKNTLAQ
ncbi:MAG TPA: hypothetical protein DEP18_06055 [Flavobacteriales bacterium]|nr:hypothetical protein [Flavobacteriales bacterium]HRE73580.1 hypothetical protein [Flavobacteriales bacterium]HRJ37287.1 hypothetical protein [Flavobacteriales bacterium]